MIENSGCRAYSIEGIIATSSSAGGQRIGQPARVVDHDLQPRVEFGQGDDQRPSVEIRHRSHADSVSLLRLQTLLHRPRPWQYAANGSLYGVGRRCGSVAVQRSAGDSRRRSLLPGSARQVAVDAIADFAVSMRQRIVTTRQSHHRHIRHIPTVELFDFPHEKLHLNNHISLAQSSCSRPSHCSCRTSAADSGDALTAALDRIATLTGSADGDRSDIAPSRTIKTRSCRSSRTRSAPPG